MLGVTAGRVIPPMKDPGRVASTNRRTGRQPSTALSSA